MDSSNSSPSFSNTTESLGETLEISPVWVSTIVMFVSCGILLLNVPSVAIVLYAKHKYPQFRSIHLLCLGITDIFVALSLIPMIRTYMFPSQMVKYWTCSGIFVFYTLTHCNSNIQIVVMCVDWLLLLIKPDWKYKGNYHKRMVRLNIVTSSIMSTAILLPFLIFSKPGKDITCELDHLFLEDFRSFSLYSSIIACTVQLFLICLCIAMIGILLKRLHNIRIIGPMTDQQVSSVSNQSRPRQRQMREETIRLQRGGTITIIVIAAMYTLSNTPLNLGFLMQGIGFAVDKKSFTKRTIRNLLATLGCLNSAINPLIYCVRVPHVKKARNLIKENIRDIYHELCC